MVAVVGFECHLRTRASEAEAIDKKMDAIGRRAISN
jgi:hypothetical protein